MYEQTEAMIRRIFPRRLCSEMKRAGICAAELTRRLEMSPDSVWPLVHGKHLPSVMTLAKLSLEFGTSTDYLLGLSNERE